MEHIPSDFYAHVLDLYVTGGSTPPERVAAWSLLLRQMLLQFDARDEGMLASISICMPPRGENERVCSTRKLFSKQNTGWKPEPENLVEFYGGDSLIGRAIQAGKCLHAPNYTLPIQKWLAELSRQRTKGSNSPVSPLFPEKGSLLVIPILRGKLIAGAISLMSVWPSFPSELWQLGFRYAEFASVIFPDEEFYEPKQIALAPMPPSSEQQPTIASFQQILSERLRKLHNSQVLQYPTEDQVWQEIEGRLLQAAQHGTR